MSDNITVLVNYEIKKIFYRVFARNKIYVEVYMRHSDIGEGEKVREDAREFLKTTYHTCKSDEAGHIAPNNCGGSGADYNLFAQERNVSGQLKNKNFKVLFQLNTGLWNRICKRITSFLSTHDR